MQKGKLIGQGNTAEIFEYGENKILKLYREGIPESICREEFIRTECAYSLKIAPKPYEIVNEGNRYGAVYEKIEGITFFKVLLSNIFKLKANAKKLARYHYLIHQKSISSSKVPTVKEKLRDDIESVDELTSNEKTKILSLLDKLDDGDRLCHFDFHPDNVIIRNKEPVIIDWMTACIGNPAADVARTCILLKTGQLNTKSKLINKIVKIFQTKLYTYYFKEYLKISGLKADEINKWESVVSAARLREWISDDEKKILYNIAFNYK